MSKKDFLKRMELYLIEVDTKEKVRFLNYYEEMIEDYLESGLSENEAVKKIGNPKELSDRFLEESGIIHKNSKRCKGRLSRIITFPLYGTMYLLICVSVICSLISLFALEGGLVVVGMVSVLGAPIVMSHYAIPVGIVQLGMGIICIGFAIVLLPLALWSYQMAINLLLRMKKKVRRFCGGVL